MVTVPGTIPLTIPDVEFIVAVPASLLLHVPPGGLQVTVPVAPTHTADVPPIAPGLAFTVTVLVTLQPVGNVYDICDVPAVSPFTIPSAEPIVATVRLLLAHVPPVGVELSVVAEPMQIAAVPVITLGIGFTVTSRVVEQPVDVSVNVMVDVPALIPFTVVVVPGDVTAATLGVLLAHEPLPAPVRPVVCPWHTLALPVMAAGGVFTVMFLVATFVQPPLVTE